jgi:uncharacterized membrane protein
MVTITKKAQQPVKGNWFQPKNLFDKIFEYGILIKGIDGVIEAVTAIALIFLSPHRLQGLVILATHRELAHDPSDFISNFLIHASQQFTNSARLFFIVYLAIHAAIKIVSVVGLLRNKMWAYPFSLIALGLLTLYQIYDIIFGSGSFFVILLTIFDIAILALIWREFQKVKREGFKKSTPAVTEA